MSKRSSKVDPSIFIFDEENESPIVRTSESAKAEFVETTDYTDIDTDTDTSSSDTGTLFIGNLLIIIDHCTRNWTWVRIDQIHFEQNIDEHR